METRILTDVAIHGAIVLTKNEEDFPLNPALGTIIIKDQCLFAYIRIGGLETWYPFANKTNSYIHTQGVASDTWTVNHNLGTENIWYQVKDSNGNIVLVGKTEIDTNTFQLNFTTPTAGTVIVVAPEDIDVPVVKASVIQIGDGEVLIDSSGVRINGSYALTSAGIDAAVAVEATARINADTTLQNNINAEATARATEDTSLRNLISALGSAFNYAGSVSGGTEQAPYQLNDLAASGKNTGDYYKVISSGWFKVGTGTAFYANLGDGLVWNNTNGVDKIDNTDPVVSGTTNFISVSGSADTGFVIDVDSTFKSRVSTAESGLSAEITARTAADTTLQNNINAEITARSLADTTLQNNINAEITARINASNLLQNGINAEITARTLADSTLQSAINAEITARTLADSTLQSAIDGKQPLDSDLTAISALDDESYGVLTKTVNGWILDDTLGSGMNVDIDAEITARTNADITLQANIDAEKTARINADITLQNNINAEITARTNADLQQYVAVNATVSTTAQTVIDSWSTSNRTAKYIIQVSQGTSYQSSEMLVVNGASSPVFTEYAILETNGSLCNFTVDKVGESVRLVVTMSSATLANIKIKRVLIEA